MKLSMLLSRLASLAIVAFALSGCEKAFDYIKQHPEETGKICSVQTLKITLIGQYEEVALSYNAAGNPTDMILTQVPAALLALDYHFRYDKHNRLTDYYFNPHGIHATFVWHRYSYPDKKTIIDSQFNYVGFIDSLPPHSSFDYYVYKNDLDASGRIIKNALFYPGSNMPFITNYSYDARGDLIRPGVVYDNKINVTQTNSVWSLVLQDYSVNNPINYPAPIQITSYNSFGLPLKLTDNNNIAGYHGNVLGYEYDDLTITYNCNGDKLPGKD